MAAPPTGCYTELERRGCEGSEIHWVRTWYGDEHQEQGEYTAKESDEMYDEIVQRGKTKLNLFEACPFEYNDPRYSELLINDKLNGPVKLEEWYLSFIPSSLDWWPYGFTFENVTANPDRLEALDRTDRGMLIIADREAIVNGWFVNLDEALGLQPGDDVWFHPGGGGRFNGKYGKERSKEFFQAPMDPEVWCLPAGYTFSIEDEDEDED
ncbi:hypothetical protein ABW19_dt0206310 [Dactylella cylindrospora]|nr:hypothetical protein ABW19_dt0206310 [Dactylella cylindrospora]